MKHKFKVGDKVRILPSAIEINIDPKEVGKTGVITYVYDNDEYSIKTTSWLVEWWVCAENIRPIIKPGQQLMFSFMSDVDSTQEER